MVDTWQYMVEIVPTIMSMYIILSYLYICYTENISYLANLSKCNDVRCVMYIAPV